ncbi:MAG: ferredoxin [Planctomycetes bacterium]|nr:ferredoxin [Planctomycetota bacterium]MCB9903125.1 ferredoxin [Planctomycetota bacterium]
MPIRRIWIDEGCISCNLCEDLAPAIFEVPVGADCTLRGGYLEALADAGVVEQVEEAADSCPTEVIIVERD